MRQASFGQSEDEVALSLGLSLSVDVQERLLNQAQAKKSSTQANHSSRASVHFSYITYQIDTIVNQRSLEKIFTKYGIVTELVIKKSNVDESTKFQSGYGFVHFMDTEDGVDAAFQTAKELFNTSIDNVQYTCKISNALQEFLEKNPFLMKKHISASSTPTNRKGHSPNGSPKSRSPIRGKGRLSFTPNKQSNTPMNNHNNRNNLHAQTVDLSEPSHVFTSLSNPDILRVGTDVGYLMNSNANTFSPTMGLAIDRQCESVASPTQLSIDQSSLAGTRRN